MPGGRQMAIGTSACDCMRTINRTRLRSQNDYSACISRRRFGQPASLPCARRSVHATCRASSPSRILLDSMISTFAATGNHTALGSYRGLLCRSRCSSANMLNARGFLSSSVSSSQAAVERSSPVRLPPPGPELKQFWQLVRRNRFQIISTSFTSDDGRYNLCATLVVPDMNQEVKAQADTETIVEAKREVASRLMSRLQEAGIWKHLIHTHSQNSRKSAGVERDVRFFYWFMRHNVGLIKIYRGRALEGITCEVTFRFSNKRFTACGRGPSKKIAKKEALCNLICRLKEIGLWRSLERTASKVSRQLRESPEESPDISNPSAADLVENASILYLPEAEELEVLQAFNKMNQDGSLFDLHVDISDSFTCHVVLTMRDRDAVVEATISAPRKEDAKKMALLHLISKLQEAGLWEDLVRGTFSPSKAEVTVDDDLVCNMQFASNYLLQAEDSLRQSFSRQRPFSGTPMVFPVSANARKRRTRELTTIMARLRNLQSPQAIAVRSAQALLPVNDFRESILDLIGKNTYSLIVAETGSGKSTQIPQMILDDAIDRKVGGDCKVLCVQPRRIAAQLLAKQVAYERNEVVGHTVGRAVRLDMFHPAITGSITYCTTGIILNYLKNPFGPFGTFTHILLDEAHVRNTETDLVMLLLKLHVEHCKATKRPAPKVILMSATIEVDLFSSYFRNEGPDGTLLPAPHISIPGRLYHVEKHFLGEILEGLESSIEPGTMSKLLSERTTATFLERHREFFPDADTIELEAAKQPVGEADEKEVPSPLPSTETDYERDGMVPSGLLAATIFHLLKTTDSGSILVFLPGLRNILDVKAELLASDIPDFDFGNDDRFRILILHSGLSEDQAELSHEVPKGCRRILLATDIAEASLTIPDVRYVVDSGRAKRLMYNNELRSSRLETRWISHSNAMQRAGRAGRVQNGSYYFLGTKRRFDTLCHTTPPEITRADLQDTCLIAKSIVPDVPVLETLRQAIEPPDDSMVLAAVESLKWLKALDEDGNLTELGSVLTRLPLKPTFGKLVLMGIVFRCLDPLLLLGAMGNDATIFRFALTEAEMVASVAHRAKYAGDSASDHISAVNALQAVRHAWQEGGEDGAHNLANSTSLQMNSYYDILNTTRYIYHTLVREGLVSHSRKAFPRKGSFCGSKLNANSHNVSLIKALLLHCLSPQIAAPRSLSSKSNYCTQKDKLAVFARTTLSDRPQLLPRALAVYSSKVHAINMMKLRSVSLISPLAACLFGGQLAWEDDLFTVNSWLHIGLKVKDASISETEAAEQMIQLASALDKAFTTLWESYMVGSGNGNSKVGTKLGELSDKRKTLIRVLENAVTNVLNRDPWRLALRENSMPGKWDEDPPIKYLVQ